MLRTLPLYVAVFIVTAPVAVWLIVVFMGAKEVRDDRRTMKEAMSRVYEPFTPSKPTLAQSKAVIACKQCGQKNSVKKGLTSRCGRCRADVSR